MKYDFDAIKNTAAEMGLVLNAEQVHEIEKNYIDNRTVKGPIKYKEAIKKHKRIFGYDRN